MIKLLEYLRRSKLLFNLSLSLAGLCIFNRQKRNLFKAKRKKRFKQVRTLIPRDKIRGYVLVCYIPYTDNPQKLRQHAVVWSSHTICRLFLDKGYLVDVVSNGDADFIPRRSYDIIFDNYWNLERFAKLQPKATKAVLFSESYQPFANLAERKRIECLGSRRKGNTCRPRRSRPDDCMDKSFAVADFAALIGNRQTLQTYPKEWRRQLTLVTTNTLNPPLIKTAEQICRSGNGFLWHFGHGAVHKGLDLVLEAFASMPLCRLHITAGLNNEPDFLKLYHRELFELPNITCHGFMDCQSAEFRSLLEQCFCFIAPSCAEGISPACAMLMKSGLYPVLSNNCGIDLPPGCGTILKNCTVSEIKQTVEKLAQTPHTKLLPQIQTCQQTALRLYSQDRFKQQLSDFIDKIISQNNRLTKEQI